MARYIVEISYKVDSHVIVEADSKKKALSLACEASVDELSADLFEGGCAELYAVKARRAQLEDQYLPD